MPEWWIEFRGLELWYFVYIVFSDFIVFLDLLITDNICVGQAGLKGCYLEVRDWQAHTLLVQEYLTTEKYYFSCWFLLSTNICWRKVWSKYILFEHTRIFAGRIFHQNIIFFTSVPPTREYFSAERFITISCWNICWQKVW